MKRSELVAILKQIDIFTSFSTDELNILADSISEITVQPQTVLFEEGSTGRDMYILLEGTLQVLKENRTITTISPIDYIGEMAIIEEKPRSATIISNTAAHLLKITSAQFQEYFSTQPQSLVSMMKTLSRRIREDTELIAQEFEKANILIHDMRNALTGFLFLDFLDTGPLNETQKKHIALMQKSRLRLTEMVTEALANAKRLHYASSVEFGSLAESITDVQEAATVHSDLKDKLIEVNLATDVPDLLFNKVDIDRVLTNLMINAGQASQAGTTITVTLARQNEQAVITVRDTGSGIPKDIQSKIFLPHFTTKEHGSGFGLASCKQIIEEKHGGTLRVESTPNVGTSFTFTLPITRTTNHSTH